MPRPLRQNEKELLVLLLNGNPDFCLTDDFLSKASVVDMSDGGMGSIRFFSSNHRHFGAAIAEADYLDDDGVPVSIVINSDNMGDLFEIDIWKVDFTPLRRYPLPQLVMKKP